MLEVQNAPIGHNLPPQPTISDQLFETHNELMARVDRLAMRANHGPREIKKAEDLDACGILVKDAGALVKDADAARKKEKQPFLDGGKEVDAFFAAALDRLERIKKAFETVATIYQRKMADEARAKAAEEARKAREIEIQRLELARKAEEANRGKHADNHTAKAEAASDRAVEAEAIAKSSAADLTRTRTESGILATAKTDWAFEITDIDQVPLEKLRMLLKREHIEMAIRLAVKNGTRELAGVRIYEDVKASFR